MLMFRHIYRYSSQRFEKFLKEIISDAQIDIGLSFKQQVREYSSIPDGHIQQAALSIYIETKTDGELYLEQMQRHVDSITKLNLSKGSAIIIGLAKKQPSKKTISDIKTICKDANILYTTITYSELVKLLNDKNIFPEHETDLQEIIEDYEEFLRTEKMLPNPYEMVAFACGMSWNENIKYGIYYEEAYKSSKANIPFMGIYSNKKITHIAEIIGSCICEVKDDEFVFEEEFGFVSQDDKGKIKDIINITKYYDLKQGVKRYYLLGELYEVNLKKKSNYGIRSFKYLDLQEISGHEIIEGDSIEEISRKVCDKSFV